MRAFMIDTHVHLTWPSFEGDVPAVLERAREAGVNGVIDLGTDLATSRRAAEHAHAHEGVYFAAGIHPNDCGNAELADLIEIAQLCRDPKCAAVGEIGLDYYREHTEPAVQQDFFRRQLALARELGKPVVIHDRNSSEDLLRVLEEEGYDGHTTAGGVFHCFAGGVEMAQEVLRRGFHISFTGNLTFKKSDRGEVAARVPLDRLLLETDSPFMAPVPRRGKRCEPAYVVYVAAKLAALHEVSLDEIARQTTANAHRLFGLNGLEEG